MMWLFRIAFWIEKHGPEAWLEKLFKKKVKS